MSRTDILQSGLNSGGSDVGLRRNTKSERMPVRSVLIVVTVVQENLTGTRSTTPTPLREPKHPRLTAQCLESWQRSHLAICRLHPRVWLEVLYSRCNSSPA